MQKPSGTLGRPRSHHPTNALTCGVGALGGRYSRAISSINDLLSAWHSMSYVRKASPVEYSRLILEGEAIINDERQAWQKTGVRKESEKTQKESEEAKKESDKAMDKATETALTV